MSIDMKDAYENYCGSVFDETESQAFDFAAGWREAIAATRAMDYDREKFEQYAVLMGHHDFERDEFDNYRNPFMQSPWHFWRASRDALAVVEKREPQ